MSWESAELGLIDGGKAVNNTNFHILEAIKNILDPSKPANKARVVTLEIKLVPTEDRENIGIQWVVKQKFPSDSPGLDMIAVRRETGEAFIQTSEQLPLGYDPATGVVEPLRKEGSDD